MGEVLFGKHRESYERLYKTNLHYRIKNAIYAFATFGSFSIVANLGAYVYVAFMIKLGYRTEIAAYIAMINALAFSSSQLKDAVENGIKLLKYNDLIANLRSFLEPKAVEDIKENKGLELESIETIEFKNVYFTYPGADRPSVENLNFTVHKNEKVAIVGYNGAGKTTFVKLMMGLYPITSGQILVNGYDIQKLDQKAYHRLFGTVFQDLQIFALPLCENVLMKTPDTLEEKKLVEDSLRKAEFGDVLDKLPDGIDTIITREFDEKGYVCSGGQAQKIAIARVFAKNPDVVILDEPSSDLDPLAEYNMYKNMMRATKNKAVLFISHRLSTARMANCIYLMKDGKIVEQGSHDELMAKDSIYRNMFELQAQNYQDSLPEDMEVVSYE